MGRSSSINASLIALASGAPSFPQKEMAALLYAGPGSLITGPVALMHHSVRSSGGADLIDVLVPVENSSWQFTRCGWLSA